MLSINLNHVTGHLSSMMTCVCVRVVVLRENITSEDCLHFCCIRAECISTC